MIKKILTLILFMGVFMVGSLNAAITDHPNWGQINAFRASIIGTINGLQQAYFVTHGHYFQGLKTPLESLELDGTEEEQIAYGLKPTDQDESWNDFSPANFTLGTKFRMHVQIDVYSAPQGVGYKIILDFHYVGIGPDPYGMDGDHWKYQHNEGPGNFGGIWDEWFIEETFPTAVIIKAKNGE